MKYWSFLTRPFPSDAFLTAFELDPNVHVKILICSILFSAGFLLTPIAAEKCFPKWYNDLDPKRKQDFPAYFMSLFHHFAIVPLAWLYIYKDLILVNYESEVVDYSKFLIFSVPYISGYTIADTFCYALKLSMKGNHEYTVHHILGLYMMYGYLTGPSQFTRFYPHVMICDTTNIFFNLAWLMRVCGLRGHPVVIVFEIIFAITFLCIRVVNLTLVFSIVLSTPGSEAFGTVRYVLPPILLLQYFWFFKILRGIFGSRLKKHQADAKDEASKSQQLAESAKSK